MSAKPDTVTGSPFVTVVRVLARYLLRSINRKGVNFFGFYEFNLDYDRNKKTNKQTRFEGYGI